ncbi:hypothetical protein GDO81_021698 [Engystomops pustulosus]|uniref:Taste receptor type 2 n=1 Tax=Engystomops pustulosus TaxID=76066 RepID=A0AAV6ZEC1_ENGPU|nr:hypothetical protein GDO81_021698 [Engystomops pustulosus]
MDPLLGVKLLVGIGAGVSGLVFNSWIVYVSSKDWRGVSHLSPPDLILTFMGLINITLQLVLSLDMSSIQTKLYSTYDQIHIRFLGLSIFLVSTNVWLTAWLSIYYCFRIVHFTGRILSLCKVRISRFLPNLLVVSTGASFLLGLLSFWNIHPVRVVDIFGNSAHNRTMSRSSLLVSSYYVTAAFVGSILPLILTLIPIVLTLSSLWRHIKRIKENKSVSCHPHTQAHVRAARTMGLLVSVHTCLLTAAIYQLSRTFNFNDTLMLFCWYFILLYPTLQALVIITGNSKLREAIKNMLSLGTFTCHQNGPSLPA